MKLRKFLASVAAAAVAVSAMTISAFAEGIYGDFAAKAEAVEISGWTVLYDCVDTAAVKADFKEKAMYVYTNGNADEIYLKVAGNNAAGTWDNGKEGIVSSTWTMDDAGCITVPYSAWGKLGAIQLGIESKGDPFTVYGVTFEGEETVAAEIAALMAGSDAAEEEATEEVEEDAAEEVEEDAAEEETTAGDVDASTDSSKGSPDTGVEDVAVVAGLAIVAAGAVLVSKKRK